MALNYGDNYVLKIKKGGVEYLVRDSIAEAAINTIQGTDKTEGSIAKAEADAKAYADSLATNYDASGAAAAAETAAKTYAKGLVDAILGEDSASTTLATLKEVIAELNDPANQGGITGTFVDTVKADLAGLTKDDGQGGTTHATVKEYVNNAVSGASSSAANAIAALDAEVTSSDGTNVQVKVTEVDGKITAVNVTTDNTVNATDVSTAISTAIQALDATPSQSAGADGLALSLTQVDGVVTGISGSIAANTYDAYGAASTVQSTVIGASGDAASADTINGAKAYADAAITALGSSTISNGVLELAL